MSRLRLPILGFVALVVVGCTPTVAEPGTVESPRVVEVSAFDSLTFDPANIAVQAGETVRFVVTSQGTLEHEFAIGSRRQLLDHAMTMTHGGMRSDSATAIRLLPGQTKELVFTFGSASDIGFGCMVAGHYPAGMAGLFTVVQ